MSLVFFQGTIHTLLFLCDEENVYYSIHSSNFPILFSLQFLITPGACPLAIEESDAPPGLQSPTPMVQSWTNGIAVFIFLRNSSG